MKMVGRRSPAFRPVIKQRIAFRKMFVHPLQEPSRKLPVGLVGKHLRLVAHGRQGKMFRQDGVRIYAEREPLVNPDADAALCFRFVFLAKKARTRLDGSLVELGAGRHGSFGIILYKDV